MTMPATDASRPSATAAAAVAKALALVVTIVCVIVPLSPEMPKGGLDESWVLALNEAVARHLVIGTDIVFTYGPYATVFTRSYHPSVYPLTVVATLYVAAIYATSLRTLARDASWVAVLAFCVAFASVREWRDALLFGIPLTVAIGVALRSRVANPLRARLETAWLFSVFGLLPLVKGSLIPLCVVVLACCAVHFVRERRRDLALAAVASATIAMPLFWVASGQSLADLPGYFRTMGPTVGGYTEAMASDGQVREIAAWLVVAIVVVATAWRVDPERCARPVAMFAWVIVLFFGFKGGFVRHDAHALIVAMGTLVVGAAVLVLYARSRLAYGALALCLLCGFYTERHYPPFAKGGALGRAFTTYADAGRGVAAWVADPRWARETFDAGLAALRAERPFALPPGSGDVYPADQAHLLASGHPWAPRPVFQSYSAYTPELAALNRAHLAGPRAPDGIVFSVDAIDGRLPALDDGASWPILLSRYRLIDAHDDHLILRKQAGALPREPLPIGGDETHRLDGDVAVPALDDFVFATIELRPTVVGKFARLLYKTSRPEIALRLADGTTRRYPFVAAMARSSFLLSPAVDDTPEAAALYLAGPCLDGRRVVSFRVSAGPGSASMWNNDFTVRFARFPRSAIGAAAVVTACPPNAAPADPVATASAAR